MRCVLSVITPLPVQLPQRRRIVRSKFRDTNLTDVASRKRLVESFVNAVFVYDDKVVFTFNYKDGSKTATIDEINAELGSDLEGTSPPNGNYPNTTITEQWVRVVFLLPPKE